MKIKKFLVITVDVSDTSDHKGYVQKTYDSKASAEEYVASDMEQFIEDANGMELDVDWSKKSISTLDGMYGCEWNIEEIEIDVPEKTYADELNSVRLKIENDGSFSDKQKNDIVDNIVKLQKNLSIH